MKVKFVPQDVEFEIQPGQSVLHVAQDHGIYIKSVCKGVPSCAECRVRLIDGEYNVLPPGSEELSLIGTGHFIDRRRLSCQLKCFGDIVVDMKEQIAKQQGLISGQKKKKLAIKDDRIEDAHAIRSHSAGGDETGGDEIRHENAGALGDNAGDVAKEGTREGTVGDLTEPLPRRIVSQNSEPGVIRTPGRPGAERQQTVQPNSAPRPGATDGDRPRGNRKRRRRGGGGNNGGGGGGRNAPRGPQ